MVSRNMSISTHLCSVFLAKLKAPHFVTRKAFSSLRRLTEANWWWRLVFLCQPIRKNLYAFFRASCAVGCDAAVSGASVLSGFSVSSGASLSMESAACLLSEEKL